MQDRQVADQSRVNAHVRTLDGKQTDTVFTTRSLSRKEKLLTGMKRLAIYWGIAVLWLPVPPFHFFMPPIFVLIGIYAFVHALVSLKSVLEETKLHCPFCGGEVVFKRRFYRATFKEHCAHCRHELRISLLDQKKNLAPMPP